MALRGAAGRRGLQLLTAGYAALTGRAESVTVRTAPADGDGTDDDRVVCPNCDAVYERDYRFCRQCVTDLPGGGPIAGTTAPASDGNVLLGTSLRTATLRRRYRSRTAVP